jgi:UDP-3-O-[3-hydroxymyristoyl] glucosamine N-acyltransferase LpxD
MNGIFSDKAYTSPLHMRDGEDSISFLESKRFLEQLNINVPGLLFITPELYDLIPDKGKVTYVIVDNPREEWANAHNLLYEDYETFVPRYHISDAHSPIDGVYVSMESNVSPKAKIYPNVVIYRRTTIRDYTEIHSGTVIGADGFSSYMDGYNRAAMIKNIGGVYIGNNVVVGANCTIDRATFGHTTLYDRVKLDDQVHVGHNAEIGEDTRIAAGVIISGSVKIGQRVWIGVNACIRDHVTIGDDAFICMGAVVHEDIPAGTKVYPGWPGYPQREPERR